MPNLIMLFAAVCLLNFSLQAQNSITIDKMPQFPGGQDSLQAYIGNELKYPEAAKDSFEQGTVIVAVIIEKDGSISNIKLEKSVSPSLDAEALRVVRSMPAWQPAMKDGNPIRTKFVLPIEFKLRAGTEENMDEMIEEEVIEKKQLKMQADEIVYLVVEEMPLFPGGVKAYLQFIQENFNIPKANPERGKILVSFIVEVDGSISKAQIVKSLGPAYDKEAVRLIESMPKWKPGKQRGQPVRVKITLPIHLSAK